jgi:hypothetical protein
VSRILAEDIFGSNYIASTSNILVKRILAEDIFGSNYIASTSNILVKRILAEDIFGSNYVASTSNILVDAIKNNKSSQWTNNSVDATKIYYNGGNVGIGTTNPANILQVGGGGRLRIANGPTDWSLIGTSDVDAITNTRIVVFGNTHGSLAGIIQYIASTSTGAHIFYTTNTEIERMRISSSGNVGIGTTDPSTYKLNVNGTINSSNYTLNGVPLNIGALSQGMTVQTKHLTYTQMDVKNNTGWDAINDDLVNGFVIAITPASASSKILVNMIAHIGTDNTTDTRWWGIKLYRKIGTGAWTEITGANGTETGAAANTNGTPVWASHNLGSLVASTDGVVYSYFIANVTGTYMDAPATTSIVYYTAYWNARIGDPNSASHNTIYINRATTQNDGFRPAPSSSWTATEIWDLGTPYVPPSGDTTITIASSSVGVGTTPTVNHKLIVNQGLTGTTGVTCIPLRISSGAYNDLGNGTATLIGLSTEPSGWTKCAIGHCRTGGWDTGAIVFICNSAANTTSLTMADERMRITSTGNVGIGTNNPFSTLHLHKNATTQDIRIIISDNTSTASASRGLHLIKGTDNLSYLWNYENTATVFATNNVERMRIANTGDVGIGTNNPQQKLDIQGTNPTIRLLDTNTDGNAIIQFRELSDLYGMDIAYIGNLDNKMYIRAFNNSATAVNHITIDRASGNVGIGTTDTATYKLNVNGTLNATSLFVGGTAFTGSSQWVGTTDIYNITGNVGIGTSTVNERLTIRGSIGRQMMLTCTTTNTSSYMGFSNSAGDGLAYIGLDGLGLTNFVYGALTLGTWKDTPILFTTGATNTEKMRIASGGNVGIGTNNPLAKLHINYTSTATNPDTGITGLYVYNPTNTAGQNSVITNRIGGSTAGSVIYGFDVSGSYGYSIKMNGNSSALRFNSGWNGAGTDRLVLGTEGTLYTTNDVWHSSIEGSQRIYYAASSTTYLRGHGGTPFVFRNGADSDIGSISSGGNLNITGSYLINGVAHNHEGTYLKYQSLDGRFGTVLHNWGYNYTYLGFGAGSWHTQNYAYIRTIQAAGDVGTFVLQFVCSSAWINMYYNGGLAMNTNWTQGSDLRIKFDINKIEDDECLSIIRNINMYKYKLKEARQQKRYGNYMNYGFIAQDILKYLPQAVSSRRNVIPSIHKPCTIIGDILELDDIDDYVDKFNNIFKFEYEAKINDVLELLIYEDFSNNDKIKLQIIEIITNTKYRILKVDGNIDYNKKYFVYGNIVDDNLSLEHSMIHNVGIGAIKCIDNEVTQLKDEIILLKNENTLLKDEIILLKEKLNLLSNHIGFGNII